MNSEYKRPSTDSAYQLLRNWNNINDACDVLRTQQCFIKSHMTSKIMTTKKNNGSVTKAHRTNWMQMQITRKPIRADHNDLDKEEGRRWSQLGRL